MREIDDVLGAHAEDHVLAHGVGGLARHRRLEEPGVGDRLPLRARNFRREEVHRRRSDEAGDEEVRGTLVQALGRVQLLELPGVHHSDAVAHRHRFDLVVRHVNRGALDALVELLEHRSCLDAKLRIEIGERLVHQEHRGLARDRSADGDTLPLPTRELLRLALEELSDAEHPADLVHASLDLLLGDVPQLESEGDVVVHAHVRIERVVLEDHGDIAILRGDVVDDTLADEDVAARLLLESGEHAQRGGLAAARRSDEHEELAVAHGDVQVVHRGDIAELLEDVVVGDGRHLCRKYPSPWSGGHC